MTLTVHGSVPHASGSVEITDKAAARARMGFNPSGNERVNRIKTLTAALYTELDEISHAARDQRNDITGREAATAATHLQAAAMFAVSAVTEPGFIDPFNRGDTPKPVEPVEPADPVTITGGVAGDGTDGGNVLA